jgi:hypothetical protein
LVTVYRLIKKRIEKCEDKTRRQEMYKTQRQTDKKPKHK